MRRILIAFALALAAGTAQAAIVYLKEGGRLEGAVVSSTDVEVVLDTAQGRVRIGMDRIRNIDYAQGAPSAPAPAAEPPREEYRVVRRRRFAPAEEPAFEPPRQLLTFDFGLDTPLSGVGFNGTAGGGSGSNGGTGPAFGLQYIYESSSRVGWGLEFHDYERGAADSSNLLPSAETRVFGETLLLLGVVKCSLTDRGGVRPFALFGAGAHRTTTTIDAEPLPGFGWPDTRTGEARRLVDDSAVGFAASARLGLDFGFADPSVFSLEAGWTLLTSASYRATPQGQALGITGVTGPLNYFTFAGRWGFGF